MMSPDLKHYYIIVSPKIDSPVGPFSPGNEVSCSAFGTFPVYIALIWNSTVLVNTTEPVSKRVYAEGNYTCKATSKYGTDKRVISVKGEKMISEPSSCEKRQNLAVRT